MTTFPEVLSNEPSFSTLAQMRMKTDVEIPVVLLFLPLSSYLLWALFAVAWWSVGDLTLLTSGLGTLGLAASAAASYVVYTLLNRGNMHASRTRALLWSALNALESKAGASNQQALLSLSSAEQGFYNLVRGERERSAVLWALLSLIPFVGWPFLAVSQWRLSRDLAKHGRLEGLVLEDVDRVLRSAGMQGITGKSVPLVSREALGVAIVVSSVIGLLSAFVLGLVGALVLTYLTVGAFSLFWIDLSIRDPAGHFHYHSQFEADLLRSLEGMADRSAGAA
jgi:hypothetical protein